MAIIRNTVEHLTHISYGIKFPLCICTLLKIIGVVTTLKRVSLINIGVSTPKRYYLNTPFVTRKEHSAQF